VGKFKEGRVLACLNFLSGDVEKNYGKCHDKKRS
jgi:hypothetical protein